jgi:hypothetical protein
MRHRARSTRVAAALALSVFGVFSFAQTPITFRCLCQNTDPSPLEPLGDWEGHALSVASYTCRVEGGPLDGGDLTGTIIYEWDKTNAVGLSANGVGRKAGAALVYQLGEFKNALTLVDGKVTGFLGSGQGTFKLATGSAASLVGKTFSYVVRPAASSQFTLEVKVE